jgi:hypothetical protein
MIGGICCYYIEHIPIPIANISFVHHKKTCANIIRGEGQWEGHWILKWSRTNIYELILDSCGDGSTSFNFKENVKYCLKVIS